MTLIIERPNSDKKQSNFVEELKEKLKLPFQYSKHFLPLVSKIKKLEEEISLLTSYSSDTIYRLRYDTMAYEYISPAVKRLLGYTHEEIKNINFRSLIMETKIISDGIHPVHSFEEFEKRRIKGNVNKWQADYLMKTKSGRKIWVSDISYPWFDEQGQLIGSIGCLRDITDRISAEETVKEELVRLAHTDPLTLIANRRAFFAKLEEEFKRINRTNSEFSILLVDIDHFKKVNDNYGHNTGDMVLKEVAKIIRSCLRETDLPARIGGEEFGIFLPDTPSKGAYFVAERICTRIAKHIFQFPDTPPIGCTVSIGLASSAMVTDRDTTKLYKMADTRLYIAKHTGRNQVSTDEIVQMH